jgi:hypothetical protein
MWCLDQLTSDIRQVVLIKIANIQEMVLLTNSTSGFMVEGSFKWYHIYTWYQPYKTMVSQVILNFK